MKKTLLLISLFTLITFNLYSHSGRTNKEGCHNVKKTGGYHCHNSKPKNNTNILDSLFENYDRATWSYDSSLSPYKNSKVGFYTNRRASKTDIDHVVALKDAHDSGGKNWSLAKKRKFANDPENQVPSLEYVNRTLKRDYTPEKFIANIENSGLYNFTDKKKCEYLIKYAKIKNKYKLNFDNNNAEFLLGFLRNECGLDI